MKTAISLPDRVFEAAEMLAADRGWSRSRLYAEALAEFVEKHSAESMTARLNAVYVEEDSGIEPSVMELQEASLPEDDW